MPCDTRIMVRLELKAANMARLKKAIEKVTGERVVENSYSLAWAGGNYYDKASGSLVVRNESVGARVKTAYTTETVKAKAARFGWQVKTVGENKFEIIRR